MKIEPVQQNADQPGRETEQQDRRLNDYVADLREAQRKSFMEKAAPVPAMKEKRQTDARIDAKPLELPDFIALRKEMRAISQSEPPERPMGTILNQPRVADFLGLELATGLDPIMRKGELFTKRIDALLDQPKLKDARILGELRKMRLEGGQALLSAYVNSDGQGPLAKQEMIREMQLEPKLAASPQFQEFVWQSGVYSFDDGTFSKIFERLGGSKKDIEMIGLRHCLEDLDGVRDPLKQGEPLRERIEKALKEGATKYSSELKDMRQNLALHLASGYCDQSDALRASKGDQSRTEQSLEAQAKISDQKAISELMRLMELAPPEAILQKEFIGLVERSKARSNTEFSALYTKTRATIKPK